MPTDDAVRSNKTAAVEDRRYRKRQAAVRTASIRFCQLLAVGGPVGIKAAVDFAAENRSVIDCSRSYTDDTELSPAFDSWRRCWSTGYSNRRSGWSDFDEREAMEDLLAVLIATGGLTGHPITGLADLKAVFPSAPNTNPFDEPRYRNCIFALADYAGLTNRLFAETADKANRPSVSLFGRWTSNRLMKWPPHADPTAGMNDPVCLFQVAAARNLDHPDAVIYRNRISPLMAALKQSATGAVYGLLERHDDIDLLAVDDNGCDVVDYAKYQYLFFLTEYNLVPMLQELRDRQRNRFETTMPTCQIWLADYLPAVLVPIVVGFLQPRPPKPSRNLAELVLV